MAIVLVAGEVGQAQVKPKPPGPTGQVPGGPGNRVTASGTGRRYNGTAAATDATNELGKNKNAIAATWKAKGYSVKWDGRKKQTWVGPTRHWDFTVSWKVTEGGTLIPIKGVPQVPPVLPKTVPVPVPVPPATPKN